MKKKLVGDNFVKRNTLNILVLHVLVSGIIVGGLRTKSVGQLHIGASKAVVHHIEKKVFLRRYSPL